MVGITNLKRAVGLTIGIANQYMSATADGFQTMDLFQFVDELSQLPAVIASADAMKEEAKDLDFAEREELNKFIIEELKVPAEKVEAVIADSMDLVFAAYKLVLTLKS